MRNERTLGALRQSPHDLDVKQLKYVYETDVFPEVFSSCLIVFLFVK